MTYQKQKPITLRIAACLGTSLAALSPVAGLAAPEAANRMMPPMSTVTAKYFASHPAEYAHFLQKLPRIGGVPDSVSANRITTASGGAWSLVAKAPVGGLCNPVLLTDATVLVASCNTPSWYKLTPDSHGNYADGTWTQLASLPVINGTQYAPLYHATGVLPDGRVIVMGGEYNGKNTGVWTNLGAIYDPVANSWTAVNAPRGTLWTNIGDAQSIVLADGTFMLASCCAYYPSADALFQPKTLTWVSTGAPRFGGGYQDEQGYELLPSANILTIDIWTAYLNNLPASTNTELYKPSLRAWTRGTDTPVSLPDQNVCGTFEIGPAALRGDGTLVAFGANTGCSAGGSPIDPTAIYDSFKNSWSTGPTIPAVCGTDGMTPCDLADAPAAVLPDGNILFAASAGYGDLPTHFFEFGTDNTITQVSDPILHSTQQGAYSYFFLDLPNGQVMMSDFSSRLEVYTPSAPTISAYAPTIATVPDTLKPGGTYKIVGVQLSGRTQGAYYGDDAQMATNYPIIRLTNATTGAVYFARSTDFSSLSVAKGSLASARFTLPASIVTGSYTLQAIANGAPSAPVVVTVK